MVRAWRRDWLGSNRSLTRPRRDIRHGGRAGRQVGPRRGAGSRPAPRRARAALGAVAALWKGWGVVKPWFGLPLYRSHDIDIGWGNSRPMTTPATASASFSIRHWT